MVMYKDKIGQAMAELSKDLIERDFTLDVALLELQLKALGPEFDFTEKSNFSIDFSDIDIALALFSIAVMNKLEREEAMFLETLAMAFNHTDKKWRINMVANSPGKTTTAQKDFRISIRNSRIADFLQTQKMEGEKLESSAAHISETYNISRASVFNAWKQERKNAEDFWKYKTDMSLRAKFIRYRDKIKYFFKSI